MDKHQQVRIVKRTLSILYSANLSFIIRWAMYLDYWTLRTPFFRQAAIFLYKKGRKDIEYFIENCIEETIGRKNAKDPDQRNNYPGYDESLFVDSMSAFFDCTNHAGFKPFLAFGSLLGLVREGRFIKWDKDIDICFFLDETDVSKLEKLLSDSGFKILVSSGNQIPYTIRCQFADNHPHIDIVFFAKDGDRLMTYGRFEDTYLVRYRTLFSLKETEYYGVKVRIPENPEIFLTENYGDWRFPKKIHHWILDSKLTNYELPEVQFFAKEYFLNCLLKNDTDRVTHYMDLFSQKCESDPFWKKVKLLIDRRFRRQLT
jgi:hypothetical protein